MELIIIIALAVSSLGVSILLVSRQKQQAFFFRELAERLARLESQREAERDGAARLAVQVTEMSAVIRQLFAGFSGMQGQLSDFAHQQRQAGEAVAALKTALPGEVAQGVQQASAALQELLRTQVLPLLEAGQQAMAQERVALEQRFADLKEGMLAAQREFAERTALESARQQQGIGRQFTEIREESLRHRHEVNALTTAALASLEDKLARLTADNNSSGEKLRALVEQRLQSLQTDNAAKLEEMRRTVDEKLHANLEQRLGESFKLVSDRLEQVHRGLGEMQSLAHGVGDLKRVLSNVKTRGTWGEMQLHQLLEQMLTAEQYVANTPTRPGSSDHVEFAVRLPGREEGECVLLPIDAKFPIEDYQRLLDAQERADGAAVEEAAKAIEARIRLEARTVCSKYINPPHTTDFALLYLPIEGLYAEVLRRPGLVDSLQRTYRVNVAGPTTLTAILNSLQMGFRTLAISRRASDVWKVLGAVKTEFGKFGDIVDATRKKLEAASKQFDQVDVRTRAIQRQLRQVEALPAVEAEQLLADGPDSEVLAEAQHLPPA